MIEMKPTDESETTAQPDESILRFGLSLKQFEIIAVLWLTFVTCAYCLTIYRERGDRIAAILSRLFDLFF